MSNLKVLSKLNRNRDKCKHNPIRLYSWIVTDCFGTDLYIGCCDCGTILGCKELKKGKLKR